jgi:hypothetical protein
VLRDKYIACLVQFGFYFIVYGIVVSSLHKSASDDTRCFAGSIFLQDTPIYIDLLTLGNTAISLLQQSFPSPPNDFLNFLFSSPIDYCTGCVLLNLSQRLLMI